ncbi:MAG: hypothetical protein HUJ61_07045, partial [Bacilli bacterium]|nr:hypothetical protein [Bacilli bacterium]
MDTNTVRGIIIGEFKKNWRSLLAMSFLVFTMIILGVVLDMLVVAGLVVIVFIFGISPFYLSMIITSFKLKTNPEFNPKDFYSSYKLAIFPGLSSSLSSVKSYFIGVFWFFAVFLISYWIFSATGVVDVTELQNIISDPDTSIDIIITKYNEILNGEPSNLGFFLKCIYTGSVGFGVLIFTTSLLGNTPIFFIQTNFGCNKKEAKYIYHVAKLKIKKSYNKILWSSIWVFLVLYPVGYFLGACIGYACFSSLNVMILCGISGAFLLSFPLLGLFVCTEDVLFTVYSPYFLVASRPIILESLKKLNNNGLPENEEKVLIRKLYVERLQQIDALNKEMEGEVYTADLSKKNSSEENVSSTVNKESQESNLDEQTSD